MLGCVIRSEIPYGALSLMASNHPNNLVHYPLLLRLSRPREVVLRGRIHQLKRLVLFKEDAYIKNYVLHGKSVDAQDLHTRKNQLK